MKIIKTNLFLLLFILITSCIVKKEKNVPYTTLHNLTSKTKLDIFTPRKKRADSLLPVLIFVHGGNWNSGKKETYGFLGKNFSKKGIVTVIPNYTLSPEANYDKMTNDVATSIKWVKKNIAQYGGDPENVFLMGHSAGGHLITLATLNSKYGIATKSISGIILDDAAGLDMYSFLKKNPPTTKNNYLTTWTKDKENWKIASPIYHIKADMPPFMIYLGKKTYPSILSSNYRFLKAIKPYQSNTQLITLNKNHVSMITQFINPRSKRYQEILTFISSGGIRTR